MSRQTILAASQMPLMRPLPMSKKDSLRKWKLERDFFLPFKNIVLYAPFGTIFDGASIPAIFRALYDPVGYLLLASIFHDICYHERRYKYVLGGGAEVFTEKVDQKKSDVLFKEIANMYYENHKIKTQVAYRSLRLGGWVAWNKNDEKYDPTKKHVFE